MKIRTQLTGSIVLFGIALLIIAASVISTNQHVVQVGRQEDLAKNVELKTNELGYLTNDYLLYRDSPQFDRWELKYDSLGEDIANLSVDVADQQMLVNDLRDSQLRLKDVFEDIVAGAGGVPGNQAAAADLAFLRVSSSRIGVQTQGMAFDASRLEQKLQDEQNQLKVFNYMQIVALLVVFGTFFLTSYILVYRRTLKSIASLQAGTEIIGSGSLDHVIEEMTNDEFSEITHAVNRMTAQLKTVTASKADLEREIAERKRAEERIRYVASFPEINPNPIFEISDAGKITYCNPAARRVFPDLEESGIRHPLLEDIGTLRDSFRDGKLNKLVRDVRIDDIFYQQAIHFLPEQMTTRIYIIDITERKRAEKALQESEERYRTLVETSPDAIVVHRDGKFLYANPAALELHGVSSLDQLRGRNILDFTHPDYRELITQFRMKEDGREKPNRELIVLRLDGQPVQVEAVSSQIFYEGDKAIQVFARDITERKQAEEELRKNEARMKALQDLNNMSEASVKELMDFGFEKAMELTGSTLGSFAVMSSDGKAAIAESYSNNVLAECRMDEKPLVFPVEGGGVWTEIIATHKPLILNDYSAPHPRKKGTPPGHVKIERLFVIPLVEGDHIVAMAQLANKPSDYDESDVRQITLLLGGLWRILSQKKAEEDLREAKLQAELYLDLMGHDISNMHQIAMGYLELASETIQTDDARKELLEKPVEILERSALLIKNVQKLQRGRSGEYRSAIYDLGELIEDVAGQFINAPNRPINIIIASAKGIRVEANELLRDVFINLIGNAIKHSDGPTIINIRMVSEKGDRFCRVMIDDNGPGIPDERKKTIFIRLRKGETTARGTGLGLYLVRTLVESYKGHVWVEDRVKGDHTKGSRFIVMLPIADEV